VRGTCPTLPRNGFIGLSLHRKPGRLQFLKESTMKNPWTKKNPFLSMWLSAANAVGGAARSRVTAETKRQARSATNKSVKQATDFWTEALTPTAPKRRKKRR
jgi:hypothetical protein